MKKATRLLVGQLIALPLTIFFVFFLNAGVPIGIYMLLGIAIAFFGGLSTTGSM